MNRRARRRARRARSNETRRAPRSRPVRLLLALCGIALIAGGTLLAVHGGTARSGRLVGFLVILGGGLLIAAWSR